MQSSDFISDTLITVMSHTTNAYLMIYTGTALTFWLIIFSILFTFNKNAGCVHCFTSHTE